MSFDPWFRVYNCTTLRRLEMVCLSGCHEQLGGSVMPASFYTYSRDKMVWVVMGDPSEITSDLLFTYSMRPFVVTYMYCWLMLVSVILKGNSLCVEGSIPWLLVLDLGSGLIFSGLFPTSLVIRIMAVALMVDNVYWGHFYWELLEMTYMHSLV